MKKKSIYIFGEGGKINKNQELLHPQLRLLLIILAVFATQVHITLTIKE